MNKWIKALEEKNYSKVDGIRSKLERIELILNKLTAEDHDTRLIEADEHLDRAIMILSEVGFIN